MFGESMIDPLARFRDLDEKVVALREAMSKASDAKEFLRVSEDSAIRERSLREEVLDFLDSATRQAAVALKDLQDSKSNLTNDRVRREMLEFVEQTRLAAEKMIEELKEQRRRILEKAQERLREDRAARRAATGKPAPTAQAAPQASAPPSAARSANPSTEGRPVLRKKSSPKRRPSAASTPTPPTGISQASKDSLLSIAKGKRRPS